MERGFDYVYVRNDQNTDYVLNESGEKIKVREEAQLPALATDRAGAYDMYAAVHVIVPTATVDAATNKITTKPVLVPTGIKVSMGDDEIFVIVNRSGNPIKRGLVQANGVGVIDADYYDIEGEICFAFYNFSGTDVHIFAGERIGQGYFTEVKRAKHGFQDLAQARTGGFGSTGV